MTVVQKAEATTQKFPVRPWYQQAAEPVFTEPIRVPIQNKISLKLVYVSNSTYRSRLKAGKSMYERTTHVLDVIDSTLGIIIE